MKDILKKWWFWTIIVLIAIVVILIMFILLNAIKVKELEGSKNLIREENNKIQKQFKELTDRISELQKEEEQEKINNKIEELKKEQEQLEKSRQNLKTCKDHKIITYFYKVSFVIF